MRRCRVRWARSALRCAVEEGEPGVFAGLTASRFEGVVEHLDVPVERHDPFHSAVHDAIAEECRDRHILARSEDGNAEYECLGHANAVAAPIGVVDLEGDLALAGG